MKPKANKTIGIISAIAILLLITTGGTFACFSASLTGVGTS